MLAIFCLHEGSLLAAWPEIGLHSASEDGTHGVRCQMPPTANRGAIRDTINGANGKRRIGCKNEKPTNPYYNFARDGIDHSAFPSNRDQNHATRQG